MILEWYWLAVIGFITLILGVFAVWKTQFQGPEAGIKARMSDFATKAVVTAAEEHKINLDFSADSIASIDTILEVFCRRHRAEPIPEKELSRIVLTFGAYVGTTLIKHHGGEWQRDSLVSGANTYPIVFLVPNASNAEKTIFRLSEAVPVMWCLKRIRHGFTESVAMRYKNVLKN